jgi:hypothetical protein
MEKAKIIAHRGNVNGINVYFENTIEYIKSALDLGFDVEIDIHEYKEKLYTGHDEPQELLPLDILTHPNCIFHAKNFQALTMLIQKNCHVFWHQNDDCTLTSRGYIWCFPDIVIKSKQSIVLDFDGSRNFDRSLYYGICTDNCINYKN